MCAFRIKTCGLKAVCNFHCRNRALEFKLTKSQKRVIKRFNKYLCDGTINKEHKVNDIEEFDTSFPALIPKERPGFDTKVPTTLYEAKPDDFDDDTQQVAPTCSKTPEEVTCGVNEGERANNIAESTDENRQVKAKGASVRKGLGADPNKPACKKAKLMRLERKRQTLADRGVQVNKPPAKSTGKTLEQFLTDVPADSKHKLQVSVEFRACARETGCLSFR